MSTAAAHPTPGPARVRRRAGSALSPYERILAGHPGDSGRERRHGSEDLGPALARASREARRRLSASQPPDPALDRVACGVGAPLAIGFLLWALQRAELRGVRRLLFPSREGVILAELGTVLARVVGAEVECRHVPASRPSWSLASLDDGNLDSALPLLVDRGAGFSVNDVLDRFGVDPGSFAAAAASDPAPALPADHRAPVAVDERAAVLRTLAGLAPVRAALLQGAVEERRRLRGWFRQEGLLDGVPTGLVDAGTGSTLYTALRSALEGEDHGCRTGLYLGLRRGAVVGPWGPPETFLFDATGNRRSRPPLGLVPFVEAVCAGRTGRMATYEVDQSEDAPGTIVPVYRPVENSAVLAWGLDRVHAALRLVTEELAAAPPRHPFADLRGTIHRLLGAFWLHPRLDEARRWASFPWEVGWTAGRHWEPLAVPFSVRRLRGGVLAVIRPEPPYWVGASLALRAPGLYALLEGASRVATTRRPRGVLV